MGVLFLAEFGWNLSVISRLKVPLATPDQGEDGHPTYRVELVKPRRGTGLHHETRNVTDHGADSPGRLITQALSRRRHLNRFELHHFRPAVLAVLDPLHRWHRSPRHFVARLR